MKLLNFYTNNYCINLYNKIFLTLFQYLHPNKKDIVKNSGTYDPHKNVPLCPSEKKYDNCKPDKRTAAPINHVYSAYEWSIDSPNSSGDGKSGIDTVDRKHFHPMIDLTPHLWFQLDADQIYDPLIYPHPNISPNNKGIDV